MLKIKILIHLALSATQITMMQELTKIQILTTLLKDLELAVHAKKKIKLITKKNRIIEQSKI